MRWRRFGDSAILIEFDNVISPKINIRVNKLYQSIMDAGILAVQFVIPAYNSLTIGFDPSLMSYSELEQEIKKISGDNKHISQSKRRHLTIPVCYDHSFALDIDEVAMITNMSVNEVISMHSNQLYDLYMIGFLPGFPYLGILPDELRVTRLAEPRSKVEKGSIGIAGMQTGIYPLSSPGGWRIIGHTPIPIFDASLTYPFLFQTGDTVRFKSISLEEHENLIDLVSCRDCHWSDFISHA